MNRPRLTLYLRLIRPHFLLGAILLYALGVGIAKYLGVTINWGLYILGQAWVTMMQLSTHMLNEYFDAPADADNPNRTPFSGGSGILGPGKLPRATALWLAYTCLAIVASLSVLLIRAVGAGWPIFWVMTLIFLGAFFYSVPPVHLAASGYGELTTSLIVSNLVPAFAFLLQKGELHRLLAMSTFPLTALHLAMMLTIELPDYATDVKHEKRTLLVRLGWQRGMTMHNMLILFAYVLFGVALVFRLPLSIALPVFFTLPLGLFQIWMMYRISEGAKPNWIALTMTAVALFGLTAYLLTFAFWTK